MQTWIMELIDSYGYFAIAALIAVENIFPPIPSEVILTFGGFLTTYTYMTPVQVILWSTVGSLIGAVVLYFLGWKLPPERIGKMLRFSTEEVAGAQQWFLRRGQVSVLLCRCVPIMRSLISVPAGMTRMNMVKFFILTTVGSAIWNTALILLGAAAGESWTMIVEYLGVYSWVVAVGLSVGIAVIMMVVVRKKFKKS
ncbi:MAG: DedA family protein [Ruminococcaceae bacterium]|nr:DedA family protein [Oscillospiraceae bacterium]